MKVSGMNEREIEQCDFYFDCVTQKAIIDFISSESSSERAAIYEEFIKPAFEKLVDGLIFTNKYKGSFGYDDLKNDCVAFLYENIEKYDPRKVNQGSKAFSYFNVMARNYLMGKSIRTSRKNKEEIRYIEQNCRDDSFRKENMQQTVERSVEENFLDKEFFHVVLNELDNWRDKFFSRDSERNLIDSISVLMKNVDRVNINNKKAVYMYLKELTGMNSKQLMINLNKVRKRYRFLKKLYDRNMYYNSSGSYCVFLSAEETYDGTTYYISGSCHISY